MLSRRLLRVKVMQIMYSYNQNNENDLKLASNELLRSISKSYELYNLILLLMLELKLLAEKRIEIGKNKRMPTPEELNPNTKFIDNLLLNQLSENEDLLRYIDVTGLSWTQDPEFIVEIYNEVIKSDLYLAYMAEETTSYDADRKFLVKLVEKVIGQYLPLYSLFEDMSIWWNDESEFIVSMIIKTFKEFNQANAEKHRLLKPIDFNDKDSDSDVNFIKTLLEKSILSREKYSELIKKFSINWEHERVSVMDTILMHIALTEIIEFPLIPLKVTLNEYIEIAKHYSTPKSGTFINGVLDKIAEHLIKEEQITKYEK